MKSFMPMAGPLRYYTGISVLLLFFGCTEPGPIELVSEDDDSDLIELSTINVAEPAEEAQSGVDSSGIFGRDLHFFGKIIYSSIRYEGPHEVDSFTLAEAVFLDRAAPVQLNGRTVNYRSLDAGALALDDQPLGNRVRTMRIGYPPGDSIIGLRYSLYKPYGYDASREHIWNCAGGAGIAAFTIPFDLPPELSSVEAVPHYLQPATPLQIKWLCANQYVNIIISREGETMQRTWVPLLHLRVRNLKNQVTIPARIIEMLPSRRYQRYLFTISSESKFTAIAGGYPEEILVHSSSIYNVVLNARP